MRQKIISRFSNDGNRNEVRKRVVNEFIEEIPGSGNGVDASKYDYYVEELFDGNHIILTRPANLKNGFDFLIRVEKIDFSNGIGRRRDYPKHDDIIADLKAKKCENIEAYTKLYSLIKQIYNCEEPSAAEALELTFEVGYPVDMILSIIKWFFIEQDIRYWNYSGRAMLMSGIPRI